MQGLNRVGAASQNKNLRWLCRWAENESLAFPVELLAPIRQEIESTIFFPIALAFEDGSIVVFKQFVALSPVQKSIKTIN
ncbi:hypothetical protein BVIET440_70031 [Burkholderia vietnamiensis]|uniref:Uncharacterized protein n=1 Tax=Burkholderia vietnamiensis TaxID=60552 RepID=A0A132DH62_BURVI|nr:hypothetical protein WI91_15595 [Burkholderia vietnamiensis]KVE63254.1 hypothetical protein WI96_18415 [Burkholderia vietnamiensis]KVF03596.1 hypothetical protein WJ04_23225 [Burkholderia vietnamiensis]KVF31548.1 hypothetical protein WJ08_14085 [Burkholderia vietnamiensis]KVF33598.1 hypothetical protein WJ09_17220 [Burkholderia vietnamiensis]